MWIFAALLNLRRILNGYHVRDIEGFCVGGKVAVMAPEVVRWKMFAGASSLGLIVVFALEILFSISAKA